MKKHANRPDKNSTSSPKKRRTMFAATVNLEFHPEIHPDDAVRAFKKWFWRTYGHRKKPPHVILEKILISSAMNGTHGKKVDPPAWRDRSGNILPVPTMDFEMRWRRAKKDGRVPLWDQIDQFILKNWRVLRHPEWTRQWPGLSEWSPRAASALIRSLPIGSAAGGESWYVKKRDRLGCEGKLHYRVHDFWKCTDGTASCYID